MYKTMFAFLVLWLSATSVTSIAQTDDYVSYQEFYDGLSPYGQWVDDSEHGYVFVPDVDDDFHPYFTNGRWAMTEFGNTWVSGYPWGWACFHYGRWVFNSFYGWVWIPGSEWGPGWVAWRWGTDVCGWAPLGPGTVWMGMGYTCPVTWWMFIHPKYLYRRQYHRHFVLRQPAAIIQRTTYVTRVHGTRYYAGPTAADVRGVTRRPVQVYRVDNRTGRAGASIRNNTIVTYRPLNIQPTRRDGQRPAPKTYAPSNGRINRPAEVAPMQRPARNVVPRVQPGVSLPPIRIRQPDIRPSSGDVRSRRLPSVRPTVPGAISPQAPRPPARTPQSVPTQRQGHQPTQRR